MQIWSNEILQALDNLKVKNPERYGAIERELMPIHDKLKILRDKTVRPQIGTQLQRPVQSRSRSFVDDLDDLSQVWSGP